MWCSERFAVTRRTRSRSTHFKRWSKQHQERKEDNIKRSEEKEKQEQHSMKFVLTICSFLYFLVMENPVFIVDAFTSQQYAGNQAAVCLLHEVYLFFLQNSKFFYVSRKTFFWVLKLTQKLNIKNYVDGKFSSFLRSTSLCFMLSPSLVTQKRYEQ